MLKRICILGVFICSGCATTVVSTGHLDGPNPNVLCPSEKVIGIRAFTLLEWNYDGEMTSATLITDPELEAEVIRSIKALGCFSEIKIEKLSADNLKFLSDKPDKAGKTVAKSGLQKAQDYLNETRAKFPSKLAADFINWNKISGFHDSPHGYAGFTFAWLMIHMVSLGLIPVWVPVHLDLQVQISRNDGKTLTSRSQSSANQWTWSPFVFRSDAIRMWELKKTSFYQKSVDTAVRTSMSDLLKN